MHARADAPREGVDRVTVVVVTCLLVFSVIRGVIPALIDGRQVGIALLVTGLASGALAIALLPAWRHRRARKLSVVAGAAAAGASARRSRPPASRTRRAGSAG
jgi:hypothetical protein